MARTSISPHFAGILSIYLHAAVSEFSIFGTHFRDWGFAMTCVEGVRLASLFFLTPIHKLPLSIEVCHQFLMFRASERLFGHYESSLNESYGIGHFLKRLGAHYIEKIVASNPLSLSGS